jgi:putative oxidoreductase
VGIWRLIVRVMIGGLFIGHGTQKLFGWFGGAGIEGTATGFEKVGLKPGSENAVLAGLAETGGGAMLAAGYETPLGASLITATMMTAIKRVHLRNGLWTQNGGYEYSLVIMAALMTIVESGPGRFSIDALRDHERAGLTWALAALGGGAAGALVVDSIAERKLPHVPHLALLDGVMREKTSAAA